MRRLWLLLGLIMLNTQAVFAFDLRVEAKPSIGAYARHNAPLSIMATLTNDGPERVVRVRAEPSERAFGTGTLTSVEQRVQLPSGARKVVPLLFAAAPSGYGSAPPIVVRVLDESGVEIASTEVTPKTLSDDDVLTVVLSQEGSGMDFLGPLWKPGGSGSGRSNVDSHVGYAPLDMLPEHWAGYAAADVVVWLHPARASLGQRQQHALLQYVAAGGALVVVPSGDVAELSGLQEVLPARVRGTALMRSAEFAVAEVPVLDLEVAGGTLLEQDGRPLLAVGAHGQGLVFQTAFDASNKDLQTDKSLDEFWRPIFKTVQEARRGRVRFTGTQNDVLERSPQMTPPSLGFLALFMLAYLLLAGPINYVMLKKRDMLLWTFLTVPLLATAFTAASFLISWHAKGSDVVVRQVAMAEVTSGGRDALVHTWLSLFSPRRAWYEVTLRGPAILDSELGRRNDHKTLNTTLRPEGFTLLGLDVEMWSMRRFWGHGPAQMAGPVNVKLSEARGFVEGTVRSPIALNRCVILSGQRVSNPFEVAAGGGDVRATLAHRYKTEFDLRDRLVNMWPVPQDQDPAVAEARDPLIRAACTAAVTAAKNGPLLLGWTQAPLSQVDVARAGGKAMDAADRPQTTLVMVRQPFPGARP